MTTNEPLSIEVALYEFGHLIGAGMLDALYRSIETDNDEVHQIVFDELVSDEATESLVQGLKAGAGIYNFLVTGASCTPDEARDICDDLRGECRNETN